jgi:hypothetical protein
VTTFPGSPRLLKGGIVLVDPDSAVPQRIIVLQYNPDSLSRSLQPQVIGGEGGDRLEALRFKGPPIETIKLDAEIDATDALAQADRNSIAVRMGIHPQLAALETLIYPNSSDLQTNQNLALAGTLEIAPAESPLTLFIWSQHRIVPVRLTEFTIVEEAFDSTLNPIRAKVSLAMRVLTLNDLGARHQGSSLFLAYQKQKEQMAKLSSSSSLADFGLERLR